MYLFGKNGNSQDNVQRVIGSILCGTSPSNPSPQGSGNPAGKNVEKLEESEKNERYQGNKSF